MLDNQKTFNADLNSLGTSTHETGTSLIALTGNPYIDPRCLWASTCMAALSVTCAVPINPAIPLPDASTSPGVKRLRELPATKPLSSSWCGRTVNIAVMRQNAVNRNANGTCLHSSVVIRMQWYFRHISPDLYLSHQYYSLFPVATSSGIIAFYILICGHFVEFI